MLLMLLTASMHAMVQICLSHQLLTNCELTGDKEHFLRVCGFDRHGGFFTPTCGSWNDVDFGTYLTYDDLVLGLQGFIRSVTKSHYLNSKLVTTPKYSDTLTTSRLTIF